MWDNYILYTLNDTAYNCSSFNLKCHSCVNFQLKLNGSILYKDPLYYLEQQYYNLGFHYIVLFPGVLCGTFIKVILMNLYFSLKLAFARI